MIRKLISQLNRKWHIYLLNSWDKKRKKKYINKKILTRPSRKNEAEIKIYKNYTIDEVLDLLSKQGYVSGVDHPHPCSDM